MNDSDEIIFALRNKISKLVSLYEKCNEDKNELIAKNIDLEKKAEEKSLKTSELEQQYANLKVAGSFSESAEAKKKINSIVREIDKCIALLNK